MRQQGGSRGAAQRASPRPCPNAARSHACVADTRPRPRYAPAHLPPCLHRSPLTAPLPLPSLLTSPPPPCPLNPPSLKPVAGEDISREVSSVASKVYLAARSWRTAPAPAGPAANICRRPMVAQLGADGSATFADGSMAERVAAVIYCTGARS
jgi:hypothetical protein